MATLQKSKEMFEMQRYKKSCTFREEKQEEERRGEDVSLFLPLDSKKTPNILSCEAGS